MSLYDSPLDDLRIASPCSADWNEMLGDERKRYCGDCKLNVYNLSGMTRYDAEHLLRLSEGRLCVRYFQRSDGTILTQECPVGWARVKQRLSVFATATFSLIVSVFAGLYFVSPFGQKTDIVGMLAAPFATPTPKYEPLMGGIAPPSQTPKPKASPAAEFKGEMVVGRPSMPNS